MMDLQTLDRVEAAFREFHAVFAPTFGRKQWRHRSRDYLQGLLVQTEERANAENLAERVDASARSLQRFLTDARWDDQAVIARLQEYLGPRLAHPEAVWVVDESGFPKQGKKSAGVARQYCGAVGKIANCQVGVFLAFVSPRGRLLVDKRLFLPEAWIADRPRCEAVGVPEPKRLFRSKSELALAMLQDARIRGHLAADWVTGDDEYGKSPDFRAGVAALGLQYVLDVPGNMRVWPVEPTWVTPPYKGFGKRPSPKRVGEERQEVRERGAALPPAAWQELTVAEGAQGPRTYRFAAERVRETCGGEPGEEVWLIYRTNRDGSEPRYYLSNASEATELATLAKVAASRWPIETELQVGKSFVGLDEYEVRTFAGWHHHITMSLLASAFLLILQQEWGEKAPRDHAAAGLSAGAGAPAATAVQPERADPMALGNAGAE
jgi:SRSO17 transposase